MDYRTHPACPEEIIMLLVRRYQIFLWWAFSPQAYDAMVCSLPGFVALATHASSRPGSAWTTLRKNPQNVFLKLRNVGYLFAFAEYHFAIL